MSKATVNLCNRQLSFPRVPRCRQPFRWRTIIQHRNWIRRRWSQRVNVASLNAQQVYYGANDGNELNGEFFFYCATAGRAQKKRVHTNKRRRHFGTAYKFSPTHESPGALFVGFSLKKILFALFMMKGMKRGKKNRATLCRREGSALPWRCIIVCVVNMMIIFNHQQLSLSHSQLNMWFHSYRMLQHQRPFNWIMKSSVVELWHILWWFLVQESILIDNSNIGNSKCRWIAALTRLGSFFIATRNSITTEVSIFKRELLHFSLHFTIARKYEITSRQIFPYPAFRFPIRTTSSAARNLQREDEKIHKFKFHFIDTSLHLNGARASTASTSFMRCQFATTKIDLCQHRLRKHLSTDRHNCFLIIRHEKLDDEVSRGAAVKWPVWLLIPS